MSASTAEPVLDPGHHVAPARARGYPVADALDDHVAQSPEHRDGTRSCSSSRRCSRWSSSSCSGTCSAVRSTSREGRYINYPHARHLRADDRVRIAHHGRRPCRRPAEGTRRPLPLAADGPVGRARGPDARRSRPQRCSSSSSCARSATGWAGARTDRSSRSWAPCSWCSGSRTRCRGCSRSSGSWSRDPETAQAAAFPLIAPLVFASSAFVPVNTMPDWLQALRAEPAGLGRRRRRTRPHARRLDVGRHAGSARVDRRDHRRRAPIAVARYRHAV